VRRDFLVFDLWGDLAHFRRYDTTSSPLSWPFPPRPTVFGTVAAILGLAKDDYLGAFQDEGVEVAVSILRRPRSLRISYNHVDTKAARDFGRMKKSGGRTQIRREVLADVRYRIFFRHPDQKLQENLTTMVRAHQSIYTVSLGLASMLADFAFVASATATACSLEEETEIISVVPYDLARHVPTPGSAHLLLTGMPRQMTPDRIVTAYQDVLYDARRPNFLVRTHEDGLTAPHVAYNFGELGIVTPL
jgi:CRISPR-associated protein Cas5h